MMDVALVTAGIRCPTYHGLQKFVNFVTVPTTGKSQKIIPVIESHGEVIEHHCVKSFSTLLTIMLSWKETVHWTLNALLPKHINDSLYVA